MTGRKWLFGVLPALLALLLALLAPTAAHGEGYTYTVRIFAGEQGTIQGQEVAAYNVPYGERIAFDIADVTLNNGSKYYVRGIRESGRDNSTVDAPAILVTGDLDYVVAYGIKGNSVAYTVRYEDEAGNALRPAATYYGNVGDKPVVAFKYIEGYRPQAYNLTKTLSANTAENVFVFVYAPVAAGDAGSAGGGEGGNAGGGEVPGTPAGGETVPPAPAPDGTGAAAPGGTGTTVPGGVGGGEAQPGGAGDALPDENAPAGPGADENAPQEPAEIVDLDEDATPLAPGAGLPGGAGGAAAESGLPLAVRAGLVTGGVLLAGALVWLLLFLHKRRKEPEDDG